MCALPLLVCKRSVTAILVVVVEMELVVDCELLIARHTGVLEATSLVSLGEYGDASEVANDHVNLGNCASSTVWVMSTWKSEGDVVIDLLRPM